MMIESVRLHRFRNYDDEMITFPKAIILLYGKNGQGKTNLLESLYMGGIGKSYRGIADADLISWNQDQASIIIQFQRSDTQQQLKIILSRTAKKELWVNETKVPQKELVGTLNEVLFSPDDLQLIKGSPSLRRRFIDMEISQVSRPYYRELLQYNRAISQRNLLLKKMKYEGIHPLDEWDRQIAGFAASLVAKRLEALHKLSFLAGVLHKRLSRGTEMLNLTYVQHYGGGDRDHQTDPEWYYALLQRHLAPGRPGLFRRPGGSAEIRLPGAAADGRPGLEIVGAGIRQVRDGGISGPAPGRCHERAGPGPPAGPARFRPRPYPDVHYDDGTGDLCRHGRVSSHLH